MDTIWQKIVDVDLSKKLHRVFGGVLLAKNDKLANRMGAYVYQDGEAANLSSYAAKGYYIRNGTETIVIDGIISGNLVYVELPGNCYFYDGSYTLTIKLVKDDKEQTLVIFDGQIAETITDAVVENESVINVQDFMQQDWLNRVETAAETALEQANIATEAATAANEAWNGVKDGLAQAATGIQVDASGDMVHITDGAEGMPVQSLITHVEPVEIGEGEKSPANPWTISGWDEVSVTGAGKNLFPVRSLTFTGQKREYFASEMPPGTYTISAEVTSADTDQSTSRIAFMDSAGNVFSYVNFSRGARDSQTVTVDRAFNSIRFYAATTVSNSTGDEATWEDIMVEKSETATAFEPYNGETLTAALPETVYGGTLDWTTGVLTVTHKRSLLNGNFTKVSTSVSGYCCGNVAIVDMMPESVNKGYCDMLTPVERPYASYVNGASIVFGFPSAPKTIYAFIPETLIAENTLDAINAYFAANPATIVYPLAEPYTIQLTPQQLETLKGVNNIWSDAGHTEVTYAADTKLYIDGKIAAIAAAIV